MIVARSYFFIITLLDLKSELKLVMIIIDQIADTNFEMILRKSKREPLVPLKFTKQVKPKRFCTPNSLIRVKY